MGRASEFIDFLNSDNLDNLDKYTGFDPFEKRVDRRKVIDPKYRKIRSEYKKRCKK